MPKADESLAKLFITLLNAANNVSTDSQTNEVDAEYSILKIKASGVAYSSTRPYNTPWFGTWGGTGFVIEGEKIVTNAHVADAQFIQVKFAKGDPNFYTAKIEKLGDDCDLAVLTVKDKKFWEKAKPLQIRDADPKVGEDIAVYGFPVGGKNISITQGEVSRTEKLHRYAHSGLRLPVAQVTAPINPGNSGGPALTNGVVTGVAFQGMSNVEGGGQIIPASVLNHFLKDEIRKTHRGFPGLSIKTQHLSKPQRKKYKLEKEQTGIRVVKIDRLSSAFGILKKDDILLKIEGYKINDDATVKLDDDELENYSVLISQKFIGDTISIQLLRNKEVLNVEIKLQHHMDGTKLLKSRAESEQEKFFWHSGMLFQVLTRNHVQCSSGFMGMLSGNRLPKRIAGLTSKHKKQESDEVIIFNKEIPCEATQDLREFRKHRVVEVNGYEINNMQDLIHALQSNRSDAHDIVFGNDSVTEAVNMSDSEQKRLLARFGIHIDRSCNLRNVNFKDEARSPKVTKRRRRRLSRTYKSSDDEMSDVESSPPSSRKHSEQKDFVAVYSEHGKLATLARETGPYFLGTKRNRSDYEEHKRKMPRPM